MIMGGKAEVILAHLQEMEYRLCLEPRERQPSEVKGDFEQVPWLSKFLTAMREAWKSVGCLGFRVCDHLISAGA